MDTQQCVFSDNTNVFKKKKMALDTKYHNEMKDVAECEESESKHDTISCNEQSSVKSLTTAESKVEMYKEGTT